LGLGGYGPTEGPGGNIGLLTPKQFYGNIAAQNAAIQDAAIPAVTITPEAIPNPFPPINYSPTTNYISPPTGDTSGMTSDGGLNLYLILGLLAVAAFAIFMVVR